MKTFNKNSIIALVGGVMMVTVIASTLDHTKGAIVAFGLGIMLCGIFAEINSLKEKK